MKNSVGIFAILAVLLVGLACSALSDETSKANSLVDEANKFVTTANESVTKGGKIADEFDGMLTKIKKNSDLEKTRGVAKDLIKEYDVVIENFKKAADKFDEASKLKINDKHKEYLEVKAKEMKLRSDYTAEAKRVPQALIDSDSKNTFNDTMKTQLAKVKSMNSDANDLSDKADKLVKDNPDIMAPPKK